MAGPVLWILRHGKAADAIGFVGGDAARPLVARGEVQSAESGARLAELAPQLDAILVSPRVRARQTAELAAAAHGSAPEPVVIDELGADYGVAALLARAAPFHEADGAHGHVVAVGHNPTLAMIVHALTGDERGLPTGTLVGIDLTERKIIERFKPTAQ